MATSLWRQFAGDEIEHAAAFQHEIGVLAPPPLGDGAGEKGGIVHGGAPGGGKEFSLRDRRGKRSAWERGRPARRRARIAVGTLIAERPAHRTVRAEFPQHMASLSGRSRTRGSRAELLTDVTNPPADAGAVVEAMVAHPAVQRVNFTGSTCAGKIVAQTCAKYLKPVVQELGGRRTRWRPRHSSIT